MSTTRRLGCSIAKSILGSKGQPRKENPFEPHLRQLIVQHSCESVEPIGELYSRTSSCRHAVCQCERLMIPTANFSNLSQVKTLCTYQDIHCFTNKDPGSARSPLSSLALDARDRKRSSNDRKLAAITAMKPFRMSRMSPKLTTTPSHFELSFHLSKYGGFQTEQCSLCRQDSHILFMSLSFSAFGRNVDKLYQTMTNCQTGYARMFKRMDSINTCRYGDTFCSCLRVLLMDADDRHGVMECTGY